MKRFKEFLQEASAYKTDYYGRTLGLNILHAGDFLTTLEDLGLNATPETQFGILSPEDFEEQSESGKTYSITLGKSSTETVYCRFDNNFLVLKGGKSSFKLFYGSRGSGKSKGGLSGRQGEMFWEWCSYLAVSNGSLPKSPDNVPESLGVKKDELEVVLVKNAKIIEGIFNNSHSLLNSVGKSSPNHIFARTEYGNGTRAVEEYYDYTENSNIVRSDQKDNTADAVWVWGTDFTTKDVNSLNFLPVPGGKGLVSVMEGEQEISQLLQVSLKKGYKLAQGGGITDGLKAKNWYDSGMKKRILDQIDPECKVMDVQVIRQPNLNEGFLDFIRKGLSKLKGFLGKFLSVFTNATKKITKEYTGSKAKKQISDISKQIGLSMNEAKGDVSYNLQNFKSIFSNSYNDITSLISRNSNYCLMDSEPNYPVEGLTQKEADSLIVNIVGLTVIYNTLSGLRELNTSELIGELRNMVMDIKMGNTKLPVVQVYGDTPPFEVFERDDENKLKEMEESVDKLKNSEFYPIVCEIRPSGKTKWNVLHMFLMKDFVFSNKEGDPPATPRYSQIILRMDGSTPKMVSKNNLFQPDWDGNNFDFNTLG